jgi:hypothetical protein
MGVSVYVGNQTVNPNSVAPQKDTQVEDCEVPQDMSDHDVEMTLSQEEPE